MSYFFSPSTGLFYNDALHAGFPPDAVSVSDADYSDLVAGTTAGRVVAGPGGYPLLQVQPPALPAREDVEVQRLRAYADPLTGSDRYFAEAQRESLLGNAEAAEAAKALGMARFAEIQAEFPWPAE